MNETGYQTELEIFECLGFLKHCSTQVAEKVICF